MKLISLNTWGGRAGKDALLDFFARHKDVDVFCLQEIFDGGAEELAEIAECIPEKEYALFSLIQNVLPNHKGFLRPTIKDYYGPAIFIRKDLTLLSEGAEFVYREKGFIPTGNLGEQARCLQYVTFQTSVGIRTISNFHGLWTGKGKEDSPERLEQSEKLVNFMKTLDHPFVVCGDFNLSPDTESIKKLERSGLRNLIQEYGISDTRGAFYKGPNKYADYFFVSDGIEVKDFRVLDEPVSDHLPLFLEWE